MTTDEAGVPQPSGTVTLVFTDIEGSTKLLEELGTTAYREALAEHRRIVREAFGRHFGYEVDYEGDAFFYAFSSASDALSAVSEALQGLKTGRIAIRVGVHTGTPEPDPPKYVGMDVHTAARIMSSGHGGQVVVSWTTAALVDASLVDLGEHRLKDIAEPVSLYQLGDGSFPPLKTISNTNLPRPASSFVGREAELAEVLSRVEQGARLVTLTGPGGTGKTRLAIEAATSLVGAYKAGIFWVGLASLRDAALVVEAISQVLGAKDDLGSHIAEREMLLLLDNLEQVIESASELSRLLESCPNLTLLVTSRELLRIQGEVEYPVPPLAETEAVALFCERARLEPSSEVAELCARLDSLPLAVELAAARTKALTVKQIAERLSSRLDLLKGGRDVDPRQQTLRATIEWSYELLAPEEQALFARLSVFAGGCTLEAAEEVADADLDTLQSLVEKSLLRFTDGRYWMLETIREYAGDRLEQTGDEETTVQRRQAEWVVALLQEAEPQLEQRRQGQWLARLSAEHDNVRRALEWAINREDADLALQISSQSATFWWIRGHATEGRRWLHGALAIHGEAPLAVRIRALEEAAHLAFRQGDNGEARQLADESIRLAQEHGDTGRLARTLRLLTLVAAGEGDFNRSQALALESADAARASGDYWALVMALNNLGLAALANDQPSQARSLLEEAASLADANEDERSRAFVLENLAFARLMDGDHLGARTDFVESLVLANELEFAEVIAMDLTGLAAVEAAGQRFVLAARVLGRADRLLEETGTHQDAIESEVRAQTLRALEVALGVDALACELQAGRAFSLDEVVALALASID